MIIGKEVQSADSALLRPRARWSVGTNPLSLLKGAMKVVPSVRYAFGLVGIVAAMSIISALVGGYRIAVVGACATLGFMVLLLLFQRLSVLDRGHFRFPALLLLWFFPVFLVAFFSLLFTSVFFAWPLSLKQWLEDSGASMHAFVPDNPGLSRRDASNSPATAWVVTFSTTRER